MSRNKIYNYCIIFSIDFLIILFSLWLSRFFGKLPRWWYLIYASVIILTIGVFTRKLQFESYKRVRFALIGIVFIDLLSVAFVSLLYKIVFPDFIFDFSVLLLALLLIVLECSYYLIYRKLILRKIPFLYEREHYEKYTEQGTKKGAKLNKNAQSKDLKSVLEYVGNHSVQTFLAWVRSQTSFFSASTMVIETGDPKAMQNIQKTPSLILALCSLNKIKALDGFLTECNHCLPQQGLLMVHCTTAALRKEKIIKSYPPVINKMVYCLDYMWHRVFSKLKLTQWIYFGITNGKYRVFPRVEVLGRLCRAGFEIKNEDFGLGEFYVVAQKETPPLPVAGTYGPLIRLKRIGKDGKIVGIYKFRTMYAYSEYLQSYVYQYNNLQEGGKFANDYRVNLWGKILRKTWLDELPMFINLLKGDIKLVGVRPLSRHYYSLYNETLKALRIKTKPGLLPPFYRDMPKTLEEVEDSELRYLNAYFEHPFRTDWNYFWGIFKNIVFKGKRSH